MDPPNCPQQTTLALFDFDGTLFRSPTRPEWWPYTRFLSAPDSLFPPLIPIEPPADWWVDSVVTDARERMKWEAGTYTVLVTGRNVAFDRRIGFMCRSHRLYFNELHFAVEDQKSTLHRKLEVLEKLVDRMPNLKHVLAYEDSAENLDAWGTFLETKKIAYTPRHIQTTPHEFLAGPEVFGAGRGKTDPK